MSQGQEGGTNTTFLLASSLGVQALYQMFFLNCFILIKPQPAGCHDLCGIKAGSAVPSGLCSRGPFYTVCGAMGGALEKTQMAEASEAKPA